MNIILIGFMGSGKSTVAKHLAKQLHQLFIEMDDLVYEKTHTKDMYEVFEKGGELLLRETEIAIAKEYAARKNLIISAGGGVVLNKIILDYFKMTKGKAVFLRSHFETIVKRLEGDHTRPLFQHLESAKKLYDFRMPLYEHYADEIIDVDHRSVNEIVFKIREILKI